MGPLLPGPDPRNTQLWVAMGPNGAGKVGKGGIAKLKCKRNNISVNNCATMAIVSVNGKAKPYYVVKVANV